MALVAGGTASAGAARAVGMDAAGIRQPGDGQHHLASITAAGRSSPSSRCSCWGCCHRGGEVQRQGQPGPSKTTHNTLIEVAWTLIPVLILVAIAVPSFRLLFLQLDIPKADLTIKATGKQWYWSYAYPDHGKFEFNSLMAAATSSRACSASTTRWWCRSTRWSACRPPAPTSSTPSRCRPSASRSTPIPGRLNETWFKATKTGMYLRPVLGTVRQGSRLHADRGAGRERSGIRRLGRNREEEICDQPGEYVRLGWWSRSRSKRTAHRRHANGTRATGPQGPKRDCKAGFEHGNSRSDTRRSRP